MKILVIQDALRSGGTERQAVFLTRALGAAGHAASLLTFRPGGALSIAPDLPPHRALQPFDLHLDWFAPGLGRAVAAARPQVVLCLGRMANCYAGGLQRRLPDAAVIATMRTGKALPWLFRRSLQRVRHIVANSREARDLLIARHGLAAAKITVIHNSLLAAPRQVGRNESLRAQFGAGPGTAVLLCVAMFRPEKNQRELIEIAAGLPPGLDWQLWFAGDGRTRAACARLAQARGIGERVRFLGLRADVSTLYAAADVAVHASNTESLSNFVIEAQAHGLPAVVSAAQGMAECLVPDRTGWVLPPGDREGFRAAVVSLLREAPATRAARGAEARRFALQAFDPDRQVAAYEKLLQDLG